MSDVLARIDNTLSDLCPCGAQPAPGSPYCGYDCEPNHFDTGTSGDPWADMPWGQQPHPDACDYNGPAVLHIGDYTYSGTARLREVLHRDSTVGFTGVLDITTWPNCDTITVTSQDRCYLQLPGAPRREVAQGDWAIATDASTVGIVGYQPIPQPAS